MAHKTQPTDVDVSAFLDAVPDARRREEGHAVRALLERVTGEPGVMWGPSMVGFGSRRYEGRASSGAWFVLGFAPRKAALTFYGLYDDYGPENPLITGLGPHTTGKGCLYVKRLDAIELAVLERLVREAWGRRGVGGERRLS